MSVTTVFRMAKPRMAPKQRGFSLVEVLITVVVFSIGLLSLAALQVKSKQANGEAAQRSIATALANDLVERMRSNSVCTDADYSGCLAQSLGAITYSQLVSYKEAEVSLRGSEPTMSNPDCGTATCTAAQVAAYDLAEWHRRIWNSSLVKPTVCVTGPANGVSGTYTVTIVWRGQAKLTNASANTCGDNEADYRAEDGTENAYRRILDLGTWITVRPYIDLTP
ncbi:MAG TPA: type IV pilus modification protein PilV [Methylococcaceae bacterium]|nr:type IV pilus modification protein PilV [Methylococcaceae bacterium]